MVDWNGGIGHMWIQLLHAPRGGWGGVGGERERDRERSDKIY